MKNDFDFIKDKLDSAKITAPAELNTENILAKTGDIKQKKLIRFDPRAFSAAAVLALFALSAVIVSSIFGNMPGMIKDESVSGLMRFTQRAAVRSALEKTIELRDESQNNDNYLAYFNYIARSQRGESSSDDSSSGSSSYISYDSAAGFAQKDIGSSSHNATYIQETGVDEADVIKTNSTHLFYLDSENFVVKVFNAAGKKSRQVAKITPTSDEYTEVMPIEFYLSGNTLILLEEYTPLTGYTTVVRAEYFDISDLKNIRLKNSFTQSGYYCSSRMTGEKLYIITTHYPSDSDDLPTYDMGIHATDDEASPDEIPPCNIYCAKNPESSHFLVVSEVGIDGGSVKASTKAILGSADEIYCNENYLYITAKYNKESKYSSYASSIETRIFKVDLKDDLKFAASAKVDGEINNQYSMDEKDGNLRVATTSNYNDYREYNNLYVLGKNLKEKGSVTEFAVEESIKAVRYIGDTAYVITYEETDPLFVIDLKNPSKPKILGEVKISGFSTLLVPVDENTLLGLGYHTQDEDDDIDMEIEEGLKLVLFDVHDKTHPKVLDTKIYKNCASAVQYNPKALLVNFERNDYTIPLNDEDKYLGGVLNFRVENGKIKVIDRYISKKYETERCAYVGNTIYLFSENYDNDFAIQIDSVDYK